MYRSIIVTVDGSPLAEKALPYAMAVGRASGAKISILQVVPAAGRNASNETTAAQADGIAHAQAHVDRLVKALGSGLDVEGVVTVGEPASAILQEAQQRQADLVVMSTHGRSGIGRWIYGSVADNVMRSSHLPVLLVSAHCHSVWPTDRRPRILVPLDGSDVARGAITAAADLADAVQGDLLLVQVVELHPPMYGDPSAYAVIDPTLELDEARGHLESVAAGLRSQGRSVQVTDAVGAAVTSIADIADKRAVDVIAMSTRGSGGLTRLIMGSVATGIVQRATTPVLVVRPTDAALG